MSGLELAAALSERNTVYNKFSERIISDYKDVLNEAINFSTDNKLNIEWYNMDFHPSNNKLLSILGVARHKVGDTVMNEETNEIIYIDESNVNNYIKPLRLILPVKSVSNKNTEEILCFIKEFSKLTIELYPDDIETMLGEDEFLNMLFTAFGGSLDNIMPSEDEENAVGDQPIKKIKRMVGGFDVADLELDEAQLNQLELLKDGSKV